MTARRYASTRARLDRVEIALTDPSAHVSELFRACMRAAMTEASDADRGRFRRLTDDECRRWQDVPAHALGVGLSETLRRVARRRLEMAP